MPENLLRVSMCLVRAADRHSVPLQVSQRKYFCREELKCLERWPILFRNKRGLQDYFSILKIHLRFDSTTFFIGGKTALPAIGTQKRKLIIQKMAFNPTNAIFREAERKSSCIMTPFSVRKECFRWQKKEWHRCRSARRSLAKESLFQPRLYMIIIYSVCQRCG